MTWRISIDVESEDDAQSVLTLLDTASQEAGVLQDVKHMWMRSYPLCETDYMAGQLCQLEDGHDGHHS